MDSVTEPYFYPEQPLKFDQIRVIEIKPGSEYDMLECTLHIVSRHSSYKALSYAWGDVTATHSILVDGEEFMIHENLFHALHAIRERLCSALICDDRSPVFLWTDKICINQSNIMERNYQVQQMGRTFSGAEEVIVWLGPTIIEKSSEYFDLNNVCCIAKQGISMSSSDWAEKRPSLLRVLGRPWFQRLWVLQEVVLANKTTFLLGPNQSCELSDLLHLINLSWNVMGAMMHPAPTVQEANAVDVALVVLRKVSMLRAVVETKKAQFGMVYLINFGVGQQCYDPRDHVFGMAGIAQHLDIEEQVEVDYSIGTRELFTRVWRQEILKSPSAFALMGVTPSSQLSVPSWVLDFTRKANQPFVAALFSAGGKSAEGQQRFDANIFSKEDPYLMRLSGFVFEQVQECYKPRDELFWRVADCVLLERHLVRRRLLLYRGKIVEASPYQTYAAKLNAFWRTLIADTSGTTRAEGLKRWPADENGAAYEVYIGRANPLPPRAGSGKLLSAEELRERRVKFYDRFYHLIAAAAECRTMFVTQSGYFGLGSAQVQAGDKVVVVPGLQMPMVLRQRSNAVANRWVFLGLTYVHGIMDGEFIEKLQKSGKLDQPEMFEID